MKRELLALVLALLLGLTGCASGGSAAVLCTSEALPAGQAIAAAGEDLSCAAAESDEAALQQLAGGQCEFTLVTSAGAEDWREAGGAVSPRAALMAFAVLSRAGDYGAWDRSTRVVIVGAQGGYGDRIAQQVLTCALYGSVRYDTSDAALEALRRGTADAVLGLFPPQDAGVTEALTRVRDCALLSLPESLIALRLPDPAMEEGPVAFGEQTAQSCALYGALCTGSTATPEQEEAVYRAAEQAGILSVASPGAILE